MNATDPLCDKTPVRAALEDAGVVVAWTIVSGVLVLAAANVEMTLQLLLIPIMTGCVQGLVTYARKRNITLPAQKEEPQ